MLFGRRSFGPSALVVALSAVAATFGASSCGAADFDPPSKLQSVRVLGTRVDKPYAAPGETVSIELLAHDGRKEKPRPMRTFWIPIVCINPAQDTYFACFQQLAGGAATRGGASGPPPLVVLPGADGGASDGGAPAVPPDPSAFLRPGVDLSAFLTEGPRFSFTLPADIVQTHAPSPGAPTPYGLAIVFNITCAGRVQIIDRTGNINPQAVPIGCFDDDGNQLGPDDYVFGFTRVYAYDTLRNQNPAITKVTFDGADVDYVAGVTIDRCVPDSKGTCPKHKVDVVVPDESQEPRPGEDSDSTRERLWATYYATEGKFGSEARILFDPGLGRVGESENEWEAPQEPGDHRMWIVVRDNRAGAVWVEFPVAVK